MTLPPLRLPLAALLFANAALASTPPLRYERDVTPGAKGANRLPVDVPLLSGAAPLAASTRDGLSDLRLFTRDGKEVPYLLVGPPRGEPAWVGGRVLAIAPTKTASGFEVDLLRPQEVDRVELLVLRAPFLKRVRLEGSGDRARWTLLAGEATLFDLPEERLRRTWLGFPSSELRYLRVTWDDARSGRVPLPSSVRARVVAPAAAAPALRVPLVAEVRASEPRVTRARLTLPGPALPIEAIEVLPEEATVLRRATVTEARLSGSELVPVPLGEATLRRTSREGAVAEELRIPIAPPSGAGLSLVVADDDNPPLRLREVAALLAPLPWIYFESPDGSPLVARYGAPAGSVPAPPRYDLEALRADLERGAVATAPATWGERRGPAGGASASLAARAVPAGSAMEADGFRFARPLPDSPAGLTALLLDAHVLASAPDLTSVRLRDGEGRQVPYLVETLGEPLAVDLGAPERVEKPGDGLPELPGSSLYLLRLPFPRLPHSRLAVKTLARVFRRKAVLYARSPGATHRRGEPAFASVAEAAWAHADPESEAPPLSLALPPLPAAEALLAIDDGDNARLELRTATLYLPARQLRFFRGEGARLTLLYGHERLAGPRYDLALLAPRLSGAAAHELTLPPTAPEALPGRTDVPRRVFWGVLVAAVVVLLAIVVKLVGKAG